MVLQRAALLWLLGRLMIAVFLLIYEGIDAVGTRVICIGAPSNLWLITMVAALTLLDVHRRHETILFANLGVRPAGILALAAVPPIVFEALTCLLPI